MQLASRFLESLLRFPGEIGAVAGRGPIPALLVGTGALIMLVAFGLVGYLTAGALVDLVTPDPGAPAR